MVINNQIFQTYLNRLNLMIFFEQTKEEQENTDINLFSKYFSYKTPDKMAQILYYSKSKADKNGEVNSIESSLD